MKTDRSFLMNRRSALLTGLAGAGALSAGLGTTASAAISRRPVKLKKGAVILF
jgi:hypothetical protein